ncbi:upf0565 protein c2orf69 homolog [Plakobranchus ocellatus]|uniref:Upf0565 protein c2orf69 homolog n=1 Tax=Plakobranchus ocellatus TaxID=259542 RepID=A0AAV4ACB1_9GAST|nr:upf0565 protein c2orf69 homolog [Plakobranchus ocellatus]
MDQTASISSVKQNDSDKNNFQNSRIISQRLAAVKGDGEKANDIFVHGDVNCQQHVIYFGGDVQDYPENMVGNNARHIQWNTEKTTTLLHSKFPSSLVFAIKAKSMHLKTLALYSNFVELKNDCGSPVHCSAYGAIRHLRLLYKSACQIVAATCREQERNREGRNSVLSTEVDKNNAIISNTVSEKVQESGCAAHDQNVPISIVAFSKGCVVLNQMVFELQTNQDIEAKEFLSRISDLYWLDGGHNGGDISRSNEHTYITEPHLVKSLADLRCQIHVDVTPYQIHDPNRPWLGKHYRRFCQLLRAAGVKLHGEVHFGQEAGSLENHFKVLEAFKV